MSFFHEWHTHQPHFLGPRALGPWGGAKRPNIFKPELQSQFQRFSKPNFVYIFSQIKDIKHIRRYFHSAACIMPRGGTWGYCGGRGGGGLGGQKFFFRNSTRFRVLVTHMNCTCTGTIFWVPYPWGLGEGSKI